MTYHAGGGLGCLYLYLYCICIAGNSCRIFSPAAERLCFFSGASYSLRRFTSSRLIVPNFFPGCLHIFPRPLRCHFFPQSKVLRAPRVSHPHLAGKGERVNGCVDSLQSEKSRDETSYFVYRQNI